MRQLFALCITLVSLAGCKKDHGANGPRVDIYLLKSYTTSVNTSVSPGVIEVSNPVLESTPLVNDREIAFYTESTATFKVGKDIQSIIKDYGPDKGFAVTVNGEPVYYGLFHPLYMSSIAFGIATIAPSIVSKNDLQIDYAKIDRSPVLEQLDKRNDSRIIEAFKASGRLR